MKIFVILSRFPYPLEKGDKLRAFHQIRLLGKKHEIILFALTDTFVSKESINVMKQYCREVYAISLSRFSILINVLQALFGGLPLQVGYFLSLGARKHADNLIERHRPDRILCQLVRTAEYAKKHAGIPAILDYMDALSTGMQRRIYHAPFFLKPLFRMEYKRLVRYEHDIFEHFKTKTIISKQDRGFILHPRKEEIAVIRNGVNTEYFMPLERKKKFDLLFTGNMRYPPNIDSVVFLVKEILPMVLNSYPQTMLLIAGANPARRVRRLVSTNVTVSGWVKDMRECYAISKIFIAPMNTGIGMQNKILEAMAMQLPCITSALVNNAIGAKEGVDVLLAKNQQEYADHIISLFEDEVKARQLALNGFHFIKKNYQWDDAVNELEKLL